MSVKYPDQGDLEGTQYVAHISASSTPGQITYYPSQPTPDFEKRLRRDKIVGTVVVIMGFALITLGFAMAFGLLGLFLLPVMLAAIFAIVFTFMFISLENPALIKTAKALPVIGYITLILLWIFLLPFLISASMASAMGSIMGDFDPSSGGNVPTPDFGIVMGAIMGIIGAVLLGTLIMTLGLMCLRGGAGVLLDSYRLRTDFSPSIIVLNVPTGIQGPQVVPPQKAPAQPPPAQPSGDKAPKQNNQAPAPEKKAEAPKKQNNNAPPPPEQPPPPSKKK
jgi:hypothetical protein